MIDAGTQAIQHGGGGMHAITPGGTGLPSSLIGRIVLWTRRGTMEASSRGGAATCRMGAGNQT